MNERAAGGVKVCRSIWESVALLSESPAENPSAGDPDDERTAKVLITASLAARPAMMAAAALQSSKPRGARRGTTVFPRQARRLLLAIGGELECCIEGSKEPDDGRSRQYHGKGFFYETCRAGDSR